MRESTFTFVPSHQFSDERDTGGHTARISFKFGRISFSLKDFGTKELIGKSVKVFVDTQKRAIAWSFLEKIEEGLESLKKRKVVSQSTYKGKLQEVFISDKHMKKPFIQKGYSGNESYKNLEIRIYEPQGLLERKYYYVIIPPHEKN